MNQNETFKNTFIGVDIEQISRFEHKTIKDNLNFLKKIFTEKEIEYCFSYKYPASHLAVRFCAKEAVVKALYAANIESVYYSDIEILHDENGCPHAALEKYPNVDIKVSMSHSKEYAIADVIIFVNK